MIKKLYLLITLLTAFLLGGTGTMWGATVTVADGSATSNYVPFYGYMGDYYMHNQVVYPASMLTGITSGSTITAMEFASSTASASWNAKVTIGLANTTRASVPNPASYDATTLTTVYHGTISVVSNKMTITFNSGNDFVYTGGNLLFDLKIATSADKGTTYPAATFSGVSSSRGSIYGYNSSAYSSISSLGNGTPDFIPKTTFTFESASNCKKPNLTRTGKTATSASFSWTAGESGESTWEYLYLPAETTLTDSHWESATETTSTSVTISGLTELTSYKFYLRAVCGGLDGKSGACIDEFTTDCTKKTLPWDEGFESYSVGSATNVGLNGCWDVLNDGASGYPQVYVTSDAIWKQNGSRGLYFVSSSSKYVYVILPEFEQTIDVLKVKFSYKMESGSTGRTITLGYMTDPANESTFHVVNTCSHKTTWTEVKDQVFSTVAEGDIPNARIAFRYGKANDNYYMGLDDIKVELNRDCSKPATPTYSDLTGSSVTVSWDANDGVSDYKYINVDRTANPSYVLDWENDATAISATSVDLDELTDGHDYEFYVMCACGTVASDACEYTPLSCPTVTGVTLSNQLYNAVTVNWTTSASTNCDVQYKAGSGEWTAAATNLDATSKTITGLTVGTEYSFRIKPNCSADGWVSPASTYTPACPALGALTLSGQTYNGVTVSWSAVAGISKWNLRYRKGSDSWTEVNNIAALTYTISSGLVTNEEYTIELYSECGGSAASTTYTPVYAIPAVLTASPVKDVTATLNWSTVDGASGYQYSCVKTGQADAWSATQVANSVALSGLEVAEEYTAKVRAIFATGNSDAKEKVFSTACQAPISLVKGAMTSSSLVFSWSKSAEGNADNRYQYVCKEGSAAPTDEQWASAVLLDEGVRAATVEGLNSNTTYYFFVRSYYGDGKYSTAINTNNTTACGTVGIGWKEDFEYSGSFPTCWDNSHYTYWGSSYIWKAATASTKHGSYSIVIDSYKYTSTSYTADLETPSISIADKANLRYYWYCESGVPYKIILKVNGNETILKNIAAAAHAWSDVEVVSIPDTCVGKTFTLIFRAQSAGVNSSRKLYLDSLSLVYKPCATPTALAATPTTDGAVVTWSHGEADGHYDLQYRVHVDEGDPNEWITVENIAEKTKTLTGLDPNNSYDVRVRANCSAHRQSGYTAGITFTPECVAPTSVEKTAETFNSVTLSWTGKADALRYKNEDDANWTNVAFDPAVTSYDGLTGLATGKAYTVQVHASCGDLWSEEFNFTPTCVAPSDLAVSSPSASGATLDWTVNSGEDEWAVQYRKKGADAWTTVENIDAHPYALSGLQPGRNYEVQVAAACNGVYNATAEFTTSCATQAPLGYAEDFENFETGSYADSKLLCWAELNASHEQYVNPYLFVNNNAAKSGSKSLYMRSLEDTYVYSILPEFSGSYAGLQLTFSHKEDALGSCTITVGYMTNVANAGSFVALHDAFSRSASWQNEIVYLESVPNGARLAFKYGGTGNADEANIDDIAISEKPSCITPTALTAASITKNSATISWTAGNEETAWKLQYKSENDADWSAEQSVETTPSKALSDLSARTLYYVRVKAVCGGSDASAYSDGTFTFKTDCDFIEIDELDEAFGATLPECWKTAKVGTNGWAPTTTPYSSATHSMCYDAQTETENSADLITPYIDIEDEANLKFQLWNSSYLGAVTAEVYADNGSETKIADLEATSGWELQTIDVSAYKTQKVRFIFRAHGKGTTEDDASKICIDDVTMEIKPCDAPTFGAGNITVAHQSATISCAESKWNLKYRTNGAGDWTAVNDITAASYKITGLTNGTTYEAQIQNVCSATRQSGWTASQTFTPNCLAPSALSAAPAVNSASISWTGSAQKLQYRLYKDEDPDEWTSVALSDASSYSITSLTASTKYEVRVQASCAGEDAEAAWTSAIDFTTWCDGAASLPLNVESFTAVPDCWHATFKGEYSGVAGGKINFYGTEEQLLVLPYISENLNKLSVTFAYTLTSATADFGYIDEPNGEFHAFASQPTSEVELDLADEATAPKYIAVRYNGGESAYGSALAISSVKVRKTPTCLKPTELAATPGVGSASISWTAGASETAWNLQYKLASAASWSENIEISGTPSYSLSGLELGTSYKVHVQANCGAEDLSDWSDEATFTTNCTTIDAIPFTEDFDAALSSCWKVYSEDETYYPSSVFNSELRLPGGKKNAGHVVVLPEITASLSNATLSIRYSASTAGETPEVGYVTDASDKETFVWLAALAKSNSMTIARIALSTVPENARLALRYDGTGSSEGTFVVDEIRISHVEVFEDTEDAENVARLTALKGQTCDVVLARPILQNGDYNTICLPFALNEAQWEDEKWPLKDFEVRMYKRSDVDLTQDQVDLYLITVSSVPAGKACFIRKTENTTDTRLTYADFRDVTISANSVTEIYDEGTGIHHIGVFDQHTLIGHDNNNLYLSTNSTLYYPANDLLMKGFRAYFQVDEGSSASQAIRRGAKVRISEPHNTPTGIDETNQSSAVRSQKVIENNQVVIIRNGVKYSIQGQKIQ